MLRKNFFVLALLASVPALGALPDTATAQISGDQGDGASTRANSLLPGDVVEIQIWREDDLSGQFTVDESGEVILPLLGARRVLGISAQALRDELTADYAVYLQNPSVTVRLLRRITVSGEVRAPGLYTVDATLSVADLIARSGGLSLDADPNKIELLRDGETFEMDLNGATIVGEAGIRSGDRITVGPRSWFSRNFPSVVGVISIISNVILIASN